MTAEQQLLKRIEALTEEEATEALRLLDLCVAPVDVAERHRGRVSTGGDWRRSVEASRDEWQ